MRERERQLVASGRPVDTNAERVVVIAEHAGSIREPSLRSKMESHRARLARQNQCA
jgi:hypothetical protein